MGGPSPEGLSLLYQVQCLSCFLSLIAETIAGNANHSETPCWKVSVPPKISETATTSVYKPWQQLWLNEQIPSPRPLLSAVDQQHPFNDCRYTPPPMHHDDRFCDDDAFQSGRDGRQYQ